LLEVASLLQRSILVAIGGTVYCHDKYLVARGNLSIATLNIVVAIGASVYCHGKCLVARGCLSIATLNIVVAIGATVYCHDKCLLLYHILQRQIIMSIVHIATPYLLQTIIACRTIYDERNI